jgi:hypothetical protein
MTGMRCSSLLVYLALLRRKAGQPAASAKQSPPWASMSADFVTVIPGTCSVAGYLPGQASGPVI